MKTTKSRFCKRCNRHVAAIPARKTAHGVNFVLTIISCGLWLPLWVLTILADSMGGWSCPVCGKRV